VAALRFTAYSVVRAETLLIIMYAVKAKINRHHPVVFLYLITMNLQENDFASRKGAMKPLLVPKSVLDQLEAGKMETINLSEWLALNQLVLLKTVLEELGLHRHYLKIESEVNSIKQKTAPKVIDAISKSLNAVEQTCFGNEVWLQLGSHKSDMVRCWAVSMVSTAQSLSLPEMLKAVKPFAADNHFGVREMAWMAARPQIASYLSESIEILSLWALHPDENIRRFSSEATRPRGVWCKHIDHLKQKPEVAESLLEPLKADASRYVQNSVANWLNDAGKTRPDWLRSTCSRWLQYSPSDNTHKIVKRAMRNVIPNDAASEFDSGN
jgi:3-methyladenine DNA glycosylase AlkC